MRNLEVETEAMQISIYCNIIIQVLKKHDQLSVNKLLVFAYLIKKERLVPRVVYNGNNTKDIVYKCISLLAGDYAEYCNSIQYVIKAIHLLKINEFIIFNDGLLCCKQEIAVDKVIYSEDAFMEKAIEASKKMTDRQFLKEVTCNV